MSIIYPYTSKTSTINEMLNKIPSIGVPKKVTQKYLVSIGLQSSADRRVIKILEFIGFIDVSGVPTDSWKSYRDSSRAPEVLANAIRDAYSPLFDMYPDAHNKDNEALTNFFKTETGLGERAVSYMVRTFKTLVELADFSSTRYEQTHSGQITPTISQSDSTTVPLDVEMPQLTHAAQTPAGLSVNINIQLTIPESKDPEVYDNFFAALKKHLLS